MKIITVIFIIGLITNCNAQIDDCFEHDFYKQALESIKFKPGGSTELSFNYTPSQFALEAVILTNLITSEEAAILEAELKKQPLILCDSTVHIIQKIKENLKPPSKTGADREFNFSRPLIVSKKLALVYYSVYRTRENGKPTKLTGGELLLIFERLKDKWILIDREILEMN